MAKSTYQQCKASIYRWREKNRELVNRQSAIRMKALYKPKLPYSFEHACRQLRNIKID